ncbi:hypothetical protein AURDEDRAFT_117046 [Auricularia subglabra TFB-10046 SS5]|nr:hypothetical protein AURDEDRAFT_117046 [Auricularia subglabra TFB-10046 SS5]
MGSLNKRHSLPLSMAVTVSGHERADRGLDDVMSSAYAQARNQARLSTIGLSMSERRLSTMTVGGLTMTRAASDRGVVRKRPSANWLAPQLESLFAAAPTPPAEEVEPDGYAWEVIDPEGNARNSPSHKRRFFARSEASVLPSPTRSLFSSKSATTAGTGSGAQRWWASLRKRVKSSPGLPLFGSFSRPGVSTLEPEEMAPSSVEEEEDPRLLLPPKEKKGGLLLRANTLTLPILTRRQRPKMPSPSPSLSSSSASTPGTDEALPLPTLAAPATLGRRRPRPPPSSKRYVDHVPPPHKPLTRGRSLLGSLRGMTPLRAES